MYKHFLQIFVSVWLCLLPVLACAKELEPNTGTVDLHSEIHMKVQISQPGGACAAGYTWHTQYGGCRRQQLEQASERVACGADYTGEQSRVRQRMQYFLQATGQVQNDPWGQWSAWDRSACVSIPHRQPGTIATWITWAFGSEMLVNNQMYGLYYRAKSMNGPYNVGGYRERSNSTTFAVTLDKTHAQLRCIFGVVTTTSEWENSKDISYFWRMNLGESIQTDHGYCQLSPDNMQVHIKGDCHTSSGGDADMCQWGGKTVAILSVSACSVVVEIRDDNPWGFLPQPPMQKTYELCS